MDAPATLAALFGAQMRPGVVRWIGLRPARRAAMAEAPQARLVARRGIEGDRYRTSSDGARQVTLIEAENVAAIASYLGRTTVDPADLRRNLVVAGINLLALKGRRFRIGEAVLEFSGECHPCSRMEEAFGPGGYNAVRGKGGVTARVIEGGWVRIGNALTREESAP